MGSPYQERLEKMLEPSELDKMLNKLLMEYHSEYRDLFPAGMDTQEKVRNSYQCFRTFRRTSDTRALRNESQRVRNRYSE